VLNVLTLPIVAMNDCRVRSLPVARMISPTSFSMPYIAAPMSSGCEPPFLLR
jgi:hypothetical protein